VPSAEEVALVPVDERRLPLPDDTLLCSLDHDVRITQL
jgi:hypothetical protein